MIISHPESVTPSSRFTAMVSMPASGQRCPLPRSCKWRYGWYRPPRTSPTRSILSPGDVWAAGCKGRDDSLGASIGFGFGNYFTSQGQTIQGANSSPFARFAWTCFRRARAHGAIPFASATSKVSATGTGSMMMPIGPGNCCGEVMSDNLSYSNSKRNLWLCFKSGYWCTLDLCGPMAA